MLLQLGLIFLFFHLALAAPPSTLANVLAQPNITTPGVDPICVLSLEPWQGTLRYTDCLTASNNLYHEFALVSTSLYAFYTTSSGFRPLPRTRGMNWKLPHSKTFGTCVVQFRMFRDFEPHEIPSKHGRWVIPASLPPAGISSWGSMLSDAKSILDHCVKFRQPGWIGNGFAATSEKPPAPIGVFMWPVDSRIAVKYQARPAPSDGTTWNASAVGLQ